MYYEAGTVLKTHPNVEYDDGVRRIYLYVGGELPEGAGEDERRLGTLLRYINESTEENATDDNTRKLDEIVKSTKAKKEIGIRYMKSWERERELIEAVREENRENIEREHKHAEEAEKRAEEAEKRAEEAEKRAEEAEKRAEEAEKRAEESEKRADKAEKRIEEAERRIKELEVVIVAKK